MKVKRAELRELRRCRAREGAGSNPVGRLTDRRGVRSRSHVGLGRGAGAVWPKEEADRMYLACLGAGLRVYGEAVSQARQQVER